MSLSPGTRLASYEIRALLGAGGMGEVYRARDTRLSRDVAIKVLPPDVGDDPGRLERLRREAILLASVTHPNVAVIHGLEESGGTRFLVLELVSAPTLADRLTRGPLPIADALAVARQIAEAIEAAHQRGVVHRDLKPGNITVARDGHVKVLDFGLAMAMATDVGDGTSGPVATLTAVGSHGAVVVGTPAYMSPEQALGKPVDTRTDIWAFGCVLYETLTGRRAFEGEVTTEIVAAVLDRQPDLDALPADAPGAIRTLLSRCLQKDPARRLRDIADARFAIEDALASNSRSSIQPVIRSNGAFGWRGAAVLALGVAGVAGWTAWRMLPPGSTPDPIRFTMSPPEGSSFSYSGVPPSFVVSPDGRHIVFVVLSRGTTTLWVRALAGVDARPLTDTDDARLPFWSPDSQSVGFFSQGKLKRIALAGGPATALCSAVQGRGGTWNRDGVIVFAPTSRGPLQRVSAAGGDPTPLTRVEGVVEQRWPHFLPDGRHFLYLENKTQRIAINLEGATIRIASLDSIDDDVPLMAAQSDAFYASHHVFFWQNGSLMAQPFDERARRLAGQPIAIAEQVALDAATRYGAFSASETGVVVYARGSTRPPTRLTWVDRTGKPLQIASERGEHINVALSPDEHRLAVSLQAGNPANRDIWIIDLTRSVTSRFTFDPSQDALPTWSPDQRLIVFNSLRDGFYNLYEMPSTSPGQERSLYKSEANKYPSDWSHDGQWILYGADSRTTGLDLWVLPVAGDRQPRPFLVTPFNEDNGRFSPDGHWLAYASDESGQSEVYVRPFPLGEGQWQISRNGGTQPMWRDDGSELFFLAPDSMLMATAIETARGFQAAAPQALFPSGIAISITRRQYSVARDGQRFLVNAVDRTASVPLTVLVNWQAAVAR